MINIICFTKKGMITGEKIKNIVNEECSLYVKSSYVGDSDMVKEAINVEESLKEWTKKHFKTNDTIIFVSATGIAVRAISECVNNKLEDSAVLVIDEGGNFVIPVLSGHIGGANDMAYRIANSLKASPVITTATDIHNAFAVDIFAKNNNLIISNKDDIKKISSKVLAGYTITMSIECGYVDKIKGIPEVIHRISYPPKEYVDIVISGEEREFNAGIVLKPRKKKFILGVGCKKGTDTDKFESYIKETLANNNIDLSEILKIASIDIKCNEEAIVSFSKKYGLTFETYTAEELNEIKGEFSSSDFVKSQVGVDNVCERAAMCGTGGNGKLILKKQACDGMTVAIGEVNKDDNKVKKPHISIVGIGPGKEDMMTVRALNVLDNSDVIVGYTVYLSLLGERFKDKRMLSTPMRKEVDRCRMAYEEALKGYNVSVICSGDAGVYGMASLMYELLEEYKGVDIEVVAGITSACSGAAVLGAPVNHDFCVISLSDALTPWELIEKRLEAAAKADFAMAIYNPSSHKRPDYLLKACDILLKYIDKDRVCGYVKNIERDGMEYNTCTLGELRETKVDMFTTVFVGNSLSKIASGKMITKRGYKL
ncbi:MAG: precorrin-3B C(17)-methyltransferase [Lachnospiraceae bacterium]|nr:precorrin-3B C(17)-methyltransferase [Lachnospiraceae bacterium]